MQTYKSLCGDDAKALSETEYFLTYENFLKCHNNFRLHFVDNWIGNIYRQQNAFQKCAQVHQQNTCAKPIFSKLTLYLTVHSKSNSNEYLQQLYKAYKLMRPFAQSNWEMFI